ncbi:hypothetical protein [[Curtobacterium] plantarum]|uniref:Uncharacterized protein n=1 Tax=[Curtobacterium] plantarum TaxID=221276 RepID=A0ABT9TCV3_9GAMM|nr:hypothetical protein [[Curtobacterium] plantarum]MDQ0020732.1 hypothetical protein [[Curtobacterium] plantarum]
MDFSDEFFFALSKWQKGWKEDQSQRDLLAKELLITTQDLDKKFKSVTAPCYRKRFLHQGELVDIVLKDQKNEGVVSWTLDKEYAEIFKGLCKANAVSGAIFEHTPIGSEVVVNVCELWKDSDFIKAATDFQVRYPEDAKALFHFKDRQSEVILTSPLKASEIIALTGASSPFDDLCDQAGIPDDSSRNELFSSLVEGGQSPGELRYTSKESAQRIIDNVIRKVHDKIEEFKRKSLNK